MPGVGGLRLPASLAYIAEPGQGVVEDRGIGTNVPGLGQLGERLSRHPRYLVVTTEQHRRVIDKLNPQLVLQPLHLAYERIDRTSRRTDGGLVDGHKQEPTVADVATGQERSVVSAPLRQEGVHFGEQTRLLFGGQCSLGGEDPHARVLWQLVECDSRHATRIPLVTQETKVCSIETRILGRYLVRTPTTPGPAPVLVGFHGYGEDAQRHLDELIRFPESDGWLMVSVQGLHRFYERKTGAVVASWMTSQDREQMIVDNVHYVDAVLEAVRASHDTTSTVVYSGFSQGVAMAYRAATHGRARPAGIIALAGDVPPELRHDETLRWPPILVGRGTEDPFYSDTKMDDDLAFLRKTDGPVVSVVFEGGHHFHDDFRSAAGRFLSSPRRSV